MTKFYQRRRTFAEILRGAEVVLLGTVRKARSSELKLGVEKARVETIYDMAVEKVIHGIEKRKTIQVRVIGGTSGKVMTPFLSKFRENYRLFILLASDIQPGSKAKNYVPYFNQWYQVKDNQIRVNKKVQKELSVYQLKAKQGKVQPQELIKVCQKILSQ